MKSLNLKTLELALLIFSLLISNQAFSSYSYDNNLVAGHSYDFNRVEPLSSRNSQDNIFCTICFEETKHFYMLSCGHEFCQECLSNIINTASKEQSLIGLRCPEVNCRRVIDISDLREMDFIGDETIDKLEELFEIINNPKEEPTDELLQQLIDQNLVKQCPRCKANIDKNAGCLHMICRCRYEFCWGCMQEWRFGSAHFFNCPASGYRVVNDVTYHENPRIAQINSRLNELEHISRIANDTGVLGIVSEVELLHSELTGLYASEREARPVQQPSIINQEIPEIPILGYYFHGARPAPQPLGQLGQPAPQPVIRRTFSELAEERDSMLFEEIAEAMNEIRQPQAIMAQEAHVDANRAIAANVPTNTAHRNLNNNDRNQELRHIQRRPEQLSNIALQEIEEQRNQLNSRQNSASVNRQETTSASARRNLQINSASNVRASNQTRTNETAEYLRRQPLRFPNQQEIEELLEFSANQNNISRSRDQSINERVALLASQAQQSIRSLSQPVIEPVLPQQNLQELSQNRAIDDHQRARQTLDDQQRARQTLETLNQRAIERNWAARLQSNNLNTTIPITNNASENRLNQNTQNIGESINGKILQIFSKDNLLYLVPFGLIGSIELFNYYQMNKDDQKLDSADDAQKLALREEAKTFIDRAKNKVKEISSKILEKIGVKKVNNNNNENTNAKGVNNSGSDKIKIASGI